MSVSQGSENVRVGDLSDARQRTIDILCQQFADDRIRVEEFERRVDLANRASSASELKQLLADLVPAQAPVPVPADNTRVMTRPTPAPTLAAGPRRTRDLMVGVMGASVRKGRWTPARSTLAIGIMGGAELDLREALLPSGVTEITTIAFMGGVEIVVPPGVRVETAGVAIMGAFEDTSDDPEIETEDTPVVRINGLAFWGAVEVSTRLPGESAKQAKKRKKALSQHRRRQLGSGK